MCGVKPIGRFIRNQKFRITDQGLSKPQALWCMYAMAIVSGFWAVLIWKSREAWQIASILAVYFGSLVIVGWKLDQAPVYEPVAAPAAPPLTEPEPSDVVGGGQHHQRDQ